jgi:hypothetical protein
MSEKAISLTEVIPARMYSFVYEGEMKLNKGGRNGVALNPLFGDVTKRAVYAGQAATGQMYANAVERNTGAPYVANPDRTPTTEETANPCVVKSLSTGGLQVRILNPRNIKTEYFVKGTPATPEQLAIIETYKPARKDSDGVRIMFPYMDNLSNVAL